MATQAPSVIRYAKLSEVAELVGISIRQLGRWRSVCGHVSLLNKTSQIPEAEVNDLIDIWLAKLFLGWGVQEFEQNILKQRDQLCEYSLDTYLKLRGSNASRYTILRSINKIGQVERLFSINEIDIDVVAIR